MMALKLLFTDDKIAGLIQLPKETVAALRLELTSGEKK